MWYRSDLNTIRYWDGATAVSLGVAGSGITNINGLTTGTQSFVLGTAGTDIGISSTGSAHTFDIPTASATKRGALSSADWTTFNAKQGSTLNSAQIWVGNSGNAATAVTMSGDATIDNAGALAIGAGKITAPMLSTGGVNAATSGVIIAGATGNLVNFACSTSGHVLKWSVTGWSCAYADAALPTLTDAKVWVGNSGNVATEVSISGDATMSNTGVVTLATSGVTAGTYSKVGVDAKGRVIASASLASSDITTALGFTPVAATSVFVNGGNNFGGATTLGTNDANDLAFETNNSTKMTILSGGNVGIGVASPAAKLEVQGQLLSKVYNAGAATSIDWNNGNMQYTTASCGAFTFSNMLEGGSYTLIVKGATSGTCTFSQTVPDTVAAGSFKYYPTNAATTAATTAVYSFVRAGGLAYVSWITGF
ncbi:MAG: hypothetical protein IPM97_04860 [Bdellovibrionaceae bacterium]|nr:hypothetical protein [Pseudobdellovibrionaceae bacterium]